MSRHLETTETVTVPPDQRPLEAQPKWRQDFPIDWSRDEYVSRRDLVKFIVLTSVAFTTGQFWLLAKDLFTPARPTLPQVALGSVDAIPVGGSKQFFYPDEHTPSLLVRTGADTFVAYNQQCTHLLCPVVPVPAEGVFHCPCHNGYFDMTTGRPIAGPPRRPLPRVRIEVRNGQLYATGVEERTV